MELYRVTASVDSDTSVQEVSKIFEGLQRLSERGTIHLSLLPVLSNERWPRVVTLTVSGFDGCSSEIAIDLSDQRDLFDHGVLGQADIYFKRSFWPDAVRALPHPLAAKVQPFGLNNPAIGPCATARLLAARLRTGRSAGGLARDARQLLALPGPQSFEASPAERTEQIVLFQTRVWPGDDPDTLQINEQRSAIVRALRRAFGTRFIGGIVPSPFAAELYSDLLTPLPYSMRAYPRVLRRALVCVYSRGLHESVAFKMSEYLAASRCIVAQTPQVVLPKPLRPDHNFLGYETPDECISQCDALLRSPKLASEMRLRNWEYYRAEVEPAAHLLRTIERAFGMAADAQRGSAFA